MMELNLKEMIIDLLTKSETTVNKLYEFVNGAGKQPDKKEFEKFRKDLISSVKRKKENILELFPIIKYFESKRLSEADLENDETLFTLPTEERIAVASPIEVLQEKPSKDTYDLKVMWDMVSIEERESLVYKAFLNYYEILKDDENIKKAIRAWGTYVEPNIYITETERDVFLEDIPQEVFSLHQSDNLSGLLPTEIAQLDDPELELIFYKNFVEKKLLSYQLWGIEREILEEMDMFEKDMKDRGPLVLCVDTSGSMRGLKEVVSKALTLVIVQLLDELGVNVVLVPFSTTARSIDLSESKNKFKTAREVLKKSYYGGSDITAAIEEVENLFKSHKYRKANVLVISDFIYKNLNKNSLEIIEKLKKRDHNFNSLKVSTQNNKNSMEKVFSSNWAWFFNFKGLNLKEDEEEIINDLANANVSSKNNLDDIRPFGFIKKVKDWEFVPEHNHEEATNNNQEGLDPNVVDANNNEQPVDQNI